MAFAAFGPGILIVTRTDIAVPIAINVGYVQEFSIDLAGTTKSLFGQKQFPLVAARSTIKATGKFKNAEISGLAWNAAFFGMSAFSTGGNGWNIGSTFTLGSTLSTAWTASPGSSLTFDTDLGVVYSTLGLPFQRVATGNEAAGKYSVGNGTPNTYTFAAADANKQISITYTSVQAGGQSLIVTNQDIGTTPTFQVDYYTNLNQPTAKPFAVRIYSCVADKMANAFKLEDFMMPEFDFSIFANPANQVLGYYFPEVS